MAIIYNGVNVAQDPLVSGTNIKTVNGTSLLGSGNIVAGGSSTDYGAIGTYVVAGRNLTNARTENSGVTHAGSELGRSNGSYYCSVNGTTGMMKLQGWASLGLTGTWRTMTHLTVSSVAVTNSEYPAMSLYVRIS